MRYGQVGRIFFVVTARAGLLRFGELVIGVGRAVWRRRAFQGKVAVSDPGGLGSEAHRPTGCGGRGPYGPGRGRRLIRTGLGVGPRGFRHSRYVPVGTGLMSRGSRGSGAPRSGGSRCSACTCPGVAPGVVGDRAADLKMPGALEVVDGVLAQVDRGAVARRSSWGSTPRSRSATKERGRCRATCWRPSIGVVPGGPAALVERRATLALVNRASRLLVLVPCRAQRGKRKRAQRARFSLPGRPVARAARPGRRRANGGRVRVTPLCCPLARVSGGRCRGWGAREAPAPVARADGTRDWWRSMERYAFPRIGRGPVPEVNTADVLETLSAVWDVKAETARAVQPAHPLGAGVGDRDGPAKRQQPVRSGDAGARSAERHRDGLHWPVVVRRGTLFDVSTDAKTEVQHARILRTFGRTWRTRPHDLIPRGPKCDIRERAA